MSHFVLASVGTHGDVLPYIALGRALRARGHRVTVAVNEHFGPLARSHGLEFAPLVTNAETEELLDNPDLWHPRKSGLVGARWGRRALAGHYEILASLCAGDDVVLAACPAVFVARVVQEKLGRPLASIFHLPWIIPSSTSPPVMMGGWTLPAWAPRPLGWMYWLTVDGIARLLVGRELNGLRRSLGLAPVRRIFRWWTSPQLSIGLFPDWFAPPQPDWPVKFRSAGFPMFDGESDEVLAPEVLNFCRAGKAPVVVTFGTGMRHARELLRETIDACVQRGERAIVLSRDSRQVPMPLPPEARWFEYVSLRRLLPHCRTIIHHGGIGTTARSLAAATPQLIIPHAWDQADNARRVERLGAGLALARGGASAKRVAAMLARLESESVRGRCREIGARFTGDDPMERAAGWLEELAGQHAGDRRDSRSLSVR